MIYSSPLSHVFRHIAAIVAGIAIIMSSLPSPLFAAGSGRNLDIVRDAEIENLIATYSRPIFKAAGINPGRVRIVLVNNQSLNAFVDGKRLFMNTGTIMQAETPNEVIGVIAHEAAHLAGGHLHRLRDQARGAQTMAVIASILGAGAAAAGAVSGASGLAGVGAGLGAGGVEASRRTLLSYQRSEEMTADRAAVDYLRKTGQSPRGMLKTFERMARGMGLAGIRSADPYQMSHPLPQERLQTLRSLAEQSPHFNKADDPALQTRHDLARAKIAAYTSGSANRLILQLKSGLARDYANAMIELLHGSPQRSLQKADALLSKRPSYAYFHELRGDALMRLNRSTDAASAYGKARKLDGSNSAILASLEGQALVASGQPAAARQAISVLETALRSDPETPIGWRFLAQAYGLSGDIAAAELASANELFYSGRIKDAKIFAARAQTKTRRGSPIWLKAQDIVQYKPIVKKR
ncbi:M48 family metalloprotease [Notoacmeibacter sp. MSK16QG-6]|uniref:M48 family metalloprotease n=1 Tax=Notoacmeibacter sp. MSK16QG-6 TaxID=2957982 RepID=UPI00209CC053|nr:M48 family metalloprotease [Notoacmeibacter sp. MSK16QG-6]MCP1197848.1 M48 family metalloprotease [Notoacmeibacter sp. MSK16QG-6]